MDTRFQCLRDSVTTLRLGLSRYDTGPAQSPQSEHPQRRTERTSSAPSNLRTRVLCAVILKDSDARPKDASLHVKRHRYDLVTQQCGTAR